MEKLPRELWIMILEIKSRRAVKERLKKILKLPILPQITVWYNPESDLKFTNYYYFINDRIMINFMEQRQGNELVCIKRNINDMN